MLSEAWHERVGFREVVNQFSANHRLRHYEWLARHYDHLQESAQAAQMQQLANHWGAIVDDLQSRSIIP